MTEYDVISVLDSIKSLEIQKDEIEEEISALKSSVIEYMKQCQCEECVIGTYTVKYSDVVSHRIDTKMLRERAPKLAQRYLVESTYKRLTIR